MGHCVIPKRTAVELYHNQSGNPATVTIFGQAISTTANSQLTTVVGLASTTLGADSVIAQASVGTYKSVTALNFKCAYDNCNNNGTNYPTGIANTFQGVYRTSSCCLPATGSTKGYWTGMTGGDFISTDGNLTNARTWPSACMCSSCYTAAVFGGNEMQNPIIWAEANTPRVCNGHGWMYHSNVIGFMPAWHSGSQYWCMCRCCWPTALSFITQAHVGHGVTAAQRAAQFMTNPMCCCAQNDTWAYKTGTNNT